MSDHEVERRSRPTDPMNLCGDPTCTAYGCSQDAIDAWNEAREADARAIVRDMLGLPTETPR